MPAPTAEPTGLVLDLTPSWTVILPVLLEARSAIRRRLAARACDGQEAGWCRTHDAGYDADAPAADAACAFAAGASQGDLARHRAGLLADLAVSDAAFAEMARAADGYNALLARLGPVPGCREP
jgi:hypothetical protein